MDFLYDILILATHKDYNKLNYLYNSILKNFEVKNINKIYCVVPTLPDNLIPNINYVLDSEININKNEINFRSNWVFQQYVKLFQQFTLDRYLVIDADVIFLKKINVFENNKINFFIGYDATKYIIQFFNYSNKMLGIGKYFDFSFISEIMFFERQIIKEMVLSKYNNIEDFIHKSNEIINENFIISEYELYGNYIYKHHKDLYNIKYLKQLKIVKKSEFTNEEIENIMNNCEFDMIAIHTVI